MRSFVESPILDAHLAADELCLVVLDLESVDIFADDEQPAFARIDVRVNAVQEILIDNHRAYRFRRKRIVIDIDSINRSVPGQRRVIGVVLGQELDHAGKHLTIEREIGHVSVDLGAPRANGILKRIVAMGEPLGEQATPSTR